jgi:predicted  nucleic acid-binding Zn-ribbon protein
VEGGGGRAKRPVGHKERKIKMHCQASSMAFQETLRELIVKMEEAIAERKERRRKEKEATAKGFVDVQLRALEVEESLAKSRLVEAKAKDRLMDVDGKSKVLDV